jgi:putative restriction endonuclease
VLCLVSLLVVTGLRLINDGWDAEVEATHIRSVGRDAPNIVSNVLALSEIAHWMFEHSLVGIDHDLSILVSRQSNDMDAFTTIINFSGKFLVPEPSANCPRTEFVTWH